MTETEKTALFTMTTGRSGTASLAELLSRNIPGVESHHEILGWDQFGVNTPEVSHMTLFNSRGNVAQVQAFWRQKLARIAALPASTYVETSHVLMKAGLVENLAHLTDRRRVHFVILTRAPYDTVMSFKNRFDFTNRSLWWMWYLDPDYPRNIVESSRFKSFGIDGVILWYLYEIRTRAAYYRRLLSEHPRIAFHEMTLEDLSDRAKVRRLLATLGVERLETEIDLPAPSNRGKNRPHWPPEAERNLRRLIESARVDPDQIARDFITSGRRL